MLYMEDIDYDIDLNDCQLVQHDGISYFCNDPVFQHNISIGQSEPYGHGQYDFIKKHIKVHPDNCRTYVDVGLHIGTTILPYSKLFKNAYGYEPNKVSYQLALANIKLNDATNCHIKNCAVLDRYIRGTSISHSNGNSGCYFFKEDPLSDIESIRLDDDPRLVDVDFIKIDTEGSELLVLKGAINILTKYKPLLQIEINGLSETNFGISQESILTFLSSLNYKAVPNTEFFICE